jgi:site-specific DNA recombinase
MSQNLKDVVGIYIRANQRVDSSLEIQKEECIQTAYKLFGGDVAIEYYIDYGKNSKGKSNQERLLQMLQDAKQGLITTVITYSISRITRNLSNALYTVESISKEGIRFISIKDGEFGTPHGNLQYNILVCVAHYLRKEHSDRIKLGMSKRKLERQQVSNNQNKKERI